MNQEAQENGFMLAILLIVCTVLIVGFTIWYV
jgi:cell division protein FtsX